MLVLVRGSSAKTVKAGLVSFVISMREIETCDAQTSVDEVLEHWNIPASRSKGADDLGSTGGRVSRLGNCLQRYVGSAKFRSVSSRHVSVFGVGGLLRDEFMGRLDYQNATVCVCFGSKERQQILRFRFEQSQCCKVR
jgi:hypothetical protein